MIAKTPRQAKIGRRIGPVLEQELLRNAIHDQAYEVGLKICHTLPLRTGREATHKPDRQSPLLVVYTISDPRSEPASTR